MQLGRISEKCRARLQFECPSFTSRKPNWHYQCISWIFHLFGRCRWQANEAWFVNLLQEKMQALAIWVIPELLLQSYCILERVETVLALAGTFQEAMESNHQAGLLDHSGSWRSRHALNQLDHCKIPGFVPDDPKPNVCVRRRTKQNRQCRTYFPKCAATVVRYRRFWMELLLFVQEPIIFVDFADSRALGMLSGQVQTEKLSFTILVEHFHNILSQFVHASITK